MNGVCTKGDKCTYSHIIKDFPCKYYITLGNCDNKDKINENQIKSKNTEEKSKNAFNLIMKNESDYYNYKSNQIKIKQITVRENKKKLTEEITEKLKGQDMKYNEKEKNISNLFQNKELKILQKGEKLNEKHSNLLLRKKEYDNLTRQNIKLKVLQFKERENKYKETRMREEQEKEIFRKKLLEKIYESQSQMTMKREKKNLDLKEKLSDLNLKIEDINENLKVKERLIEMEKKKHFEKMEEKNKKVEQMKYEKLQYQNHRRQINRNLEMDKEKIEIEIIVEVKVEVEVDIIIIKKNIIKKEGVEVEAGVEVIVEGNLERMRKY